MKTQFSSFAISTLILSATTFSTPTISTDTKEAVKVEAAQHADFSFFRTHKQGKGVTATWGLTSSAGVASFKLERTYEDPTDSYAEWQEVSSGACNGSKSYKCHDVTVSPGFANYRVIVLMEDGSTTESSISTIQVFEQH